MNDETLIMLQRITTFIEKKMKEGREATEKEVWIIKETGNSAGWRDVGINEGKSLAYRELLLKFRDIADESIDNLKGNMSKTIAHTFEEATKIARKRTAKAFVEYEPPKELTFFEKIKGWFK